MLKVYRTDATKVPVEREDVARELSGVPARPRRGRDEKIDVGDDGRGVGDVGFRLEARRRHDGRRSRARPTDDDWNGIC